MCTVFVITKVRYNAYKFFRVYKLIKKESEGKGKHMPSAAHEKPREKKGKKFHIQEPELNGSISIVSKKYSQKRILFQVISILFFVLIAMATAAVATFIWREQIRMERERAYQLQTIKATAEFEDALLKVHIRNETLQNKVDRLERQNIYLRKERDQIRKDLMKIVEKKNETIADLRSVKDKILAAEREKSQALSLLEALEKKYSADDAQFRDELAMIERIEFLKETFPEYKKIRGL